jgi:hypothetical protein
MILDKYAEYRKVVYYYLSEITINNNKNIKRREYRSLDVETIYLNDKDLEYRKKIINNYSNVLSIINELKYLPPTKFGRFLFKGGFLYNEAKNSFEKNEILLKFN